jgi:hypothetical protein
MKALKNESEEVRNCFKVGTGGASTSAECTMGLGKPEKVHQITHTRTFVKNPDCPSFSSNDGQVYRKSTFILAEHAWIGTPCSAFLSGSNVDNLNREPFVHEEDKIFE